MLGERVGGGGGGRGREGRFKKVEEEETAAQIGWGIVLACAAG